MSASGLSASKEKRRRRKKRRKKVDIDSSGPPEIKPEEITYFEKIGGGCYGNVYRGECRGKEVAVKKLLNRHQNISAQTIAEFKKEVEICSRLSHPNVLLFMGACTKPKELAIVTELMPKGNLETLLRDEKADLPLRQRMLFAKDTALGMNWLHRSTPAIIHRDLKPSNLLIDKWGVVKVCDFGLSAIKHTEKLRDKDSIPGTPLWMAPEVLMGKDLDEKCDIYSYGIVLWEIYTREEPFPEFQSYKDFKRAITLEHVRPPIPKNTPASLARLMELCWDKEQSKRPSFSEIISMLEVVIVDVTIFDDLGNKFWKKFFLGKEHVPWEEFAPKFAEFLKLPYPDLDDITWKAFHEVLTIEEPESKLANPPKVVSMEKFGHTLDWLGPVEVASSNSFTILDRVVATVRLPYFHGDIQRRECEQQLRKKNPGTFLVRISTTQRGSFTISKMSRKGRVNHQRIDYKPGKGFSIKMATSSSTKVVSENVPHLGDFMDKIMKALHLTAALTPSPYESLFDTDDSNVEGYLQYSDDDDSSSSSDDYN